MKNYIKKGKKVKPTKNYIIYKYDKLGLSLSDLKKGKKVKIFTYIAPKDVLFCINMHK